MANWVIAEQNRGYTEGAFGLPSSLVRIIQRRGVKDSEIADFISATPGSTYDPFLLPNLKEVCLRLMEAAEEGRFICVYGDYDADGVTSTALMVKLLKHFTDKVTFFIPSRFTDGYGPTKGAFDRIKARGVDFIVTVDCGITSRDEIEYAKSLGMECIVTDHHIIREGMTPECLTVNPHLAESEYPFADLSGCGVAFKIAQGISRLSDKLPRQDLFGFLDLVAISTVADVVPLLDENRAFVKYGLDRINRMDNGGIKALLRELSLFDAVTASDISFTIAPNINALGRMGNADKGVELLAENGNEETLKSLAIDIIETNKTRKEIQGQTIDRCKEVFASEDCGDYAPVLFVPDAHEGVAGIVAGNLKEELNKPVCIVSPTADGTMKGTGRSIPGINLHELFENCGDVFNRFGGHAGACGFTVKEGCLELFRERLNSQVKDIVDRNPDVLTKNIYIEKELEPQEKTLDFAEKLKLLEPYGEANPVPLFCIKNAWVRDIKYLGAEGQHIRFTVCTGDEDIQCIAFWGKEKYDDILGSGRVDVAGEITVNEFRGKKSLQIKIADIRKSQNAY